MKKGLTCLLAIASAAMIAGAAAHAAPTQNDDGFLVSGSGALTSPRADYVSNPSLTTAGPPVYAHFQAGGSLDFTGDVQPGYGYYVSGFVASMLFTASGDTYPLFPDSFTDFSVVRHDRPISLVANQWLPISFLSMPLVESTAGGSFDLGRSGSFWSAPRFAGSGGGSIDIGTRTGLFVADPQLTGSASVTNNYGVEIEYLNAGVHNAGIVNHSVTAHPPSNGVQTLDAATDQIVADQGTVEVEVTGTSSLLLTSTPTIPDGIPGQSLTLINAGSNTLRLSDFIATTGSNLRLPSATVSLGPGDVLTLHFSETIGDWVATGFTNNRS